MKQHDAILADKEDEIRTFWFAKLKKAESIISRATVLLENGKLDEALIVLKEPIESKDVEEARTRSEADEKAMKDKKPNKHDKDVIRALRQKHPYDDVMVDGFLYPALNGPPVHSKRPNIDEQTKKKEKHE